MRSEVPGPGYYPLKGTISANGEYFLFTLKASLARRFSRGRADRMNTIDSGKGVPGPGTYAPVTEFGNYGSPIVSRKNQARFHRRNSSQHPADGSKKATATTTAK